MESESIQGLYQIGELARRASVSTRTIRFYEEKGLLGTPARTSGGMRLYDDRDVNRVRLIRRLRNVGLDLDEIKDALSFSPEVGRRARVERTLSVLKMEANQSREKVAELQRESTERDEVVSLVSKCLECNLSECPKECRPQTHVL